MLETLLNGLRDLHRNHEKSYGRERGETIQEQAEYACTFARKNSILIEPGFSFEDLITSDETRNEGTAISLTTAIYSLSISFFQNQTTSFLTF